VGDLFEPRYRALAELPERIRTPTLLHLHGDLFARAATIATLRGALLDGELPPLDAFAWPDEPLRSHLRDAFARSHLAPDCLADPGLVDEVLLYVLQEVETSERFYERALQAFNHLRPEETASDEEDDPSADAGTLARQLTLEAFTETMQAWLDEHVAVSRELSGAVRDLGVALRLPPGSMRGVLQRLPRDDVLQLRALIARTRELEQLVAALGRGMESGRRRPLTRERRGANVARTQDVVRLVRGPRGAHVRGVERSGDPRRMLSSEAALLGHPVLRWLWHARRAERTLLGYRADGLERTEARARRRFDDGVVHEHERAERGPILVLVDTSDSMSGTREAWAKAVVLQMAARCAVEQRRCYLYAFSGPGNLLEHEVGFGDDALPALLTFLSRSFHGGTMPGQAVRRACERLLEADWRQSDLVLVSDGYFFGFHVRPIVERVRARCGARLVGIRVRADDVDVATLEEERKRSAERAGMTVEQVRAIELEEVQLLREAQRQHYEDVLAYVAAETGRPLAELISQADEEGGFDRGFEQLGCDEIHDVESWGRPLSN